MLQPGKSGNDTRKHLPYPPTLCCAITSRERKPAPHEWPFLSSCPASLMSHPPSLPSHTPSLPSHIKPYQTSTFFPLGPRQLSPSIYVTIQSSPTSGRKLRAQSRPVRSSSRSMLRIQDHPPNPPARSCSLRFSLSRKHPHLPTTNLIPVPNSNCHAPAPRSLLGYYSARRRSSCSAPRIRSGCTSPWLWRCARVTTLAGQHYAPPLLPPQVTVSIYLLPIFPLVELGRHFYV